MPLLAKHMSYLLHGCLISIAYGRSYNKLNRGQHIRLSIHYPNGKNIAKLAVVVFNVDSTNIYWTAPLCKNH